MNFNPREAAREVLASTTLTDPTEIADAVFEATPKAAIPGCYRALLRALATEEIRIARMRTTDSPIGHCAADTQACSAGGGTNSTGGGQLTSDPQRAGAAPRRTANKSSRVAAIRNSHEALLAQRVFARSSWKLLGDCTLQDVLDLAAQRREIASRNESVAARFEKIAAQMKAANAATVRDLGSAVAA